MPHTQSVLTGPRSCSGRSIGEWLPPPRLVLGIGVMCVCVGLRRGRCFEQRERTLLSNLKLARPFFNGLIKPGPPTRVKTKKAGV